MNDYSNYRLISLKEIFDNGNRIFRIPTYQRGYSWGKSQRNDLLKDIENVLLGDYMHFTGTIVATPSLKDNNHLDIVDGQQRLTSLLILLAIIYHSYREKPEERPLVIENIMPLFLLDGIGSGNSIRKFHLQPEHDIVFDHLVRYEPYRYIRKSKTEVNIIDAVGEFEEWIKLYLEERLLIAETIINKLGFLFYIPQKTNEIGIMFEVINNRGKDLSELEKVKNYLVYFADRHNVRDLKRIINLKWSVLLTNLHTIGFDSNDAENSFLRNCWIVYKDTRKSESKNIYDNLKINFPIENRDNWTNLKDFVVFLEDASFTYKKLYSREEISNIKEERKLEQLYLHGTHASILPILLAVYNKVLDLSQRLHILELLEKLNFRYYVLKIAKRNDTGQGWLFDLAYKLYNDEDFDVDALTQSLLKFIQYHTPDNLIKDVLTIQNEEDRKNIYKKDWLKFFLASYEEHLRLENKESIDLIQMCAPKSTVKAQNDFFHKEHIWASKDYSTLADSKRQCMDKRRLGNFILLKETQNIKVSNERPETKIELYWNDRKNDPNTLMIRELRRIFTNAQNKVDKRWQKKTKNYWLELYHTFLDSRERRLIKFALQRWGI